jgi:hypothetical protein
MTEALNVAAPGSFAAAVEAQKAAPKSSPAATPAEASTNVHPRLSHQQQVLKNLDDAIGETLATFNNESMINTKDIGDEMKKLSSFQSYTLPHLKDKVG